MVCIDDEIPFEIPNGWLWCRVRDISQSYIGLTYKPSDVASDGVIVLRSSNIQNGKITLNDIVRVKSTISEKLWVEKNDIVICARNGSKKLVGKSAIVEDVSEPMTFGAFMAICKTHLYRFVYIYLQSDLFFSQLRSVSGTTTINQLTQNNFNGFLVPIPPKQEQERICNKLSHILPVVEKYGDLQDKQDSLNSRLIGLLKKSILQEAIQGKLVPQCDSDEPVSELLQRIKEEKQRLIKEGKLKKKDVIDSIILRGDNNKYWEKRGNEIVCIDDEIPFEIPNTWAWSRLGFIFSHCTGKALNSSNNKGTPLQYITTSNLYWERFELGTLRTMPFTDEELDKCTITKGDLLVCEGGDVGRAAIWNYDFDMRIQNHIHKLRSYIPLITKFFYYVLFYYKHSGLIGGKGIGIKGLSSSALHNLLIPIPPINEQERIVIEIERSWQVL